MLVRTNLQGGATASLWSSCCATSVDSPSNTYNNIMSCQVWSSSESVGCTCLHTECSHVCCVCIEITMVDVCLKHISTECGFYLMPALNVVATLDYYVPVIQQAADVIVAIPGQAIDLRDTSWKL